MADYPTEMLDQYTMEEDPGNNNFEDPLEENLNAEFSVAVTTTRGPRQSSSTISSSACDKSSADGFKESIDKSVNTKDNIRPRSQCNGGTKQLKLKYVTKGRASNAVLKERALDRINKKVGEEKANEILARWKEISQQNHKSKKEVRAEGDGIIKTLLSLGFSKAEVTTFLQVGGPRVNRIMAVIKNPTMIKSSKPPAHAASEEDVKRVLAFITSLDLEPGFTLVLNRH